MAETDLPESIDAFYEKGRFFRVIHADGVFGGPSPRGIMTISFYSERMALPRRTRIPIVDGMPGTEEILETKGGLFRELESTVMMDIAVAASFHNWLGNQIDEMAKKMGISPEALAAMKGKGIAK